MQGNHNVLSYFPQPAGGARLLGARQSMEQGINHDVADKDNRAPVRPFTQQGFVGVARRRQKQRRKPIGHYPIDLFRHRSITATQASLDMRYWNTEL